MGDKVFVCGVVVMVPEGLNIVADVATPRLVHCSSVDLAAVSTYLIVIKPTPVSKPIRIQSCQNSIR